MKWLKKHGLSLFFALVLLIGAGIYLYPYVSAFYNSFHESRVVANYDMAIEDLTDKDYSKFFDAADKYNKKLALQSTNFKLSDTELAEYNRLLDPLGTGMMGYITIDSINVNCPIYHGTSDDVLASGIGHLAGSSLPVGGESTHTVLSGHRGLPSATLFTDLDKLSIGDRFQIHILDRDITYEVDQILTVLPEQTEALSIVPGKEYCTLVTCTPYGINTHRLLVRGHKVANDTPDRQYIAADAEPVDTMTVAAVIGVIIILILFVRFLIVRAVRNRKRW